MKKIYKILNEINEGEDFISTDDYIEAGLLDSLDIVSLVDSLEGEYGIAISGSDIIPENFINACKIAALVARCGGKIE